MAGNREPLFNYKLFNTRTGKYMSWRSKSTWTSRPWVVARLHGERVSEIEVHIFPVNKPTVVSAKEFLEEEAILEKEKNEKKLLAEGRRQQEQARRQHLEDLRKLAELQERIDNYKKVCK